MSSDKTHIFVDSRKIIDRVKTLSVKNQKTLAKEIFGISDTNLYNRIRDNRLDFYKLFVWAAHNNVDLNWLIWGKGHVPDRQKPATGPTTDDERAWFRGLIDELRAENQELKKKLADRQGAPSKKTIRRGDNPADRDAILKKRAT